MLIKELRLFWDFENFLWNLKKDMEIAWNTLQMIANISYNYT